MMFYFRGKWSYEYPIIVNSIKRRILSSISRELLEIPNRPGAILQSTKRGVKAFDVNITINDLNVTEYNSFIRELAGWLYSDIPEEFVLSKDPTVTFRAVLEGSTDLEEIVTIGKGTLTFICPDPDGDGVENVQTVNDPNSVNDNGVLLNRGTAGAQPTFVATVLEPITFLDIVSPESYMRIGEPIDVESETPKEENQLVLYDEMATTTGWTSAGTVVEGSVAGTISIYDGYAFNPTSYGSGSGWHGPALKKSIPGGPLTDFRMDAIVSLYNEDPAAVGRVELVLLDDQNKVICKLAMKDTHGGASSAVGEVRLGDETINYHLINEPGSRQGIWNNFYGMLRIQRHGKRWHAYIAEIDRTTWKHHTRLPVYWTDEDEVFDRQVAQIQVHFGAMGTIKPTSPLIYSVRVWKINNLLDNEIPYIAYPDDVIEFDHKSKEIRINGETRNDLKDFGASFFPIGVGETEIAVNPSTAAVIEAKWREKWL